VAGEREGTYGEVTNTIGAFDARTHFANLLNRVEQGEVLTITRNRRPVAVLTPAPTSHRVPHPSADLREQFRDFRAAHPLSGQPLKEMIDDGRRL
jgi:prevent-host-death family protein